MIEIRIEWYTVSKDMIIPRKDGIDADYVQVSTRGKDIRRLTYVMNLGASAEANCEER